MRDAKGNQLKIGDRVKVIEDDSVHAGAFGFVARLRGAEEALIRDEGDPDFYVWENWYTSISIEKVEGGS